MATLRGCPTIKDVQIDFRQRRCPVYLAKNLCGSMAEDLPCLKVNLYIFDGSTSSKYSHLEESIF